ncbi:MAG: methionyl-tRNA formyltransferase [Clostridia bacterium]|nr:methionyl-tRNA formyltransferase [Clostridia bacterium]
MKIVYMGTPDFAVPCLERLVKDGYDVACVVTQPDKPRGRKQEMTPSEVKVCALEHGIEVYQPQTLRSEEAYEYLKSFDADYFIVAAYGKILPKNILDLPKYACINVHGSLLPAYRGAAPIQRSVLAGDNVTGITTMLMGEGLDTGDMLLKSEYEIDINATSGEVFDALAESAPDLLIETIEKFTKGEIVPEKQDESKATYAHMLSKDEAVIDWNKSSAEIHNLVRGMAPWPVAYSFYGDKKIKIFTTRLTDEKTSLETGKLKEGKNSILVSCGDGKFIEVVSLQLEGGKRLDAKQFLAGHPVTSETKMG